MSSDSNKSASGQRYDDDLSRKFDQLKKGDEPDSNIFSHYENTLGPQLENNVVVDWGAGSGRFLDFYLSHSPSQILAIEPSQTSLDILKNRFKSNSKLSYLNSSIEGTNVLPKVKAKTFHFLNFVINCFKDFGTPISKIRGMAQKGDSIIVVTSVFIEPDLYNKLNEKQVHEPLPFETTQIKAKYKLPKNKTFEVFAESKKLTLNDFVHVLPTSMKQIQSLDGVKITSSLLFNAAGFVHKINPNDHFGDYKFAVLYLELECV